MSEQLYGLANAFHAAAEHFREPRRVHPMLERLNLPEDPTKAMSRQIATDVLQAIGDTYLKLADLAK